MDYGDGAQPDTVVETGDGVAAIARDEWNALVGEGSPFLEWEWLASLEEAGCTGGQTGWQPQPLLVRQGTRLVAACPLYVKAHSEGEFVFDWGWADAAQRAGIEYYPKLLVGSPFSPVSGTRFLTAPGVDRAAMISLLGDALRQITSDNGLSSVHVNFCAEDEVEILKSRGYELRVGFQYHWQNAGYESFDDYLAGLRSKRRNQVRRERRRVVEQGVATEVLRGDAIPDAVFDPLFACYAATVDNHYYGRRYLNREFFELLKQRFKHRLCFVVAKRGSQIVAGTTNIVKRNTLYGRYWGALEEVRFLHFDVCYYSAIEHCIEAGLTRFEPGAGGDYKFLRGFDPQPTHSLHYVTEPRLAHAIKRFLEQEREQAGSVIDQLSRQSAVKNTRTSTDPA